MKRTTTVHCLLILAGLLSSRISFAQSHGMVSPIRVGTVTINLGVGVGADYKSDNYGTAFGTKAAAEWALWQAGPGVISIGPEIGGSFSTGDYYGYNNYKAHTWVIAGRGAWHYGWQVPGLDTYGGFSAGVGLHQYSFDNGGVQTYNSTIPVFGGFVGASYFISEGFGFNAEAGYDITNFQAGIIFRFD